jgi:hypothetical protein
VAAFGMCMLADAWLQPQVLVVTMTGLLSCAGGLGVASRRRKSVSCAAQCQGMGGSVAGSRTFGAAVACTRRPPLLVMHQTVGAQGRECFVQPQTQATPRAIAQVRSYWCHRWYMHSHWQRSIYYVSTRSCRPHNALIA